MAVGSNDLADQQIIEALIARNPRAAETAMRNHIERSRSPVAAAFAR